MRVLHIPYYYKNPYQRLLIQALNAQGVEAEGGSIRLGRKGGIFPIRGLVRECGKPDVLHLHWVHTWFGLALQYKTVPLIRCKVLAESIRFIIELVWLRSRGVKVVWTVHNLVGHESLNVRQELFFRHILARLCDYMIVHCPEAQDQVVNVYRLSKRARVAVIPLGEYGCYENEISRQQARKKLQIGPDERVFLFFGRISPQKGIFELLEAFRRLEATQARLLIVGSLDPSEEVKERLQNLCEDDERIQPILGFLPDEQIQVYMNAADVVVLPFQKVLTSSTVMLALSFGKPVIAPRLGCIPYVLEGTDNLLYHPTAESGLLHAMQQALQMDLEQVGRGNLQRAAQFDWDTIAKATREVYKQCLDW